MTSELMRAVESLGRSLGVNPEIIASTRQPACFAPMRQGDEKVCRCGLRWPANEERPHCDWADGPYGA